MREQALLLLGASHPIPVFCVLPVVNHDLGLVTLRI
jgi:hypothetical protein